MESDVLRNAMTGGDSIELSREFVGQFGLTFAYKENEIVAGGFHLDAPDFIVTGSTLAYKAWHCGFQNFYCRQD